MAIDHLARTSIQFTIEDKSYSKAKLLKALLENNNLLEVKNYTDFFAPKAAMALEQHLNRNIKAVLKDSDIKVYYKGGNKGPTRNFRFDDPNFYQSKSIIFKKFHMKQGVKDAPVKLAALKWHMLKELTKCKNLKVCIFALEVLEPEQKFLNSAELNFLKISNKDCTVIQHNPSKYQSYWLLYLGLLASLSLFVASVVALPLYGMNVSMPLMIASGISSLAASLTENWRQRFLFNLGKKYLLALRDGSSTNDQSIKDSLIIGEASKEWKGYFKSYLNFKTYLPKNYAAYAAGLYTGVNDLHIQREAIKKLRV
jgi:hypothetical protein